MLPGKTRYRCLGLLAGEQSYRSTGKLGQPAATASVVVVFHQFSICLTSVRLLFVKRKFISMTLFDLFSPVNVT